MRINTGRAAKHRRNNGKYGTCGRSAREKTKKKKRGKSGRVALTGMALVDMHFWVSDDFWSGYNYSGHHLPACSRARAEKCPKECFWSTFGHLAQSIRKSALKSAFWQFGAPKVPALRVRCPQALQKYSLGTFRPGPLSTPVNGGRNRK